ncbi:hypothetical protein NPIL_446501 [Nephila pilipes]|uniref:Uncharacterized protein n=1 Tax=Nephila pilipes TaxID=299642 RepID=A0A8X6NGA1_NEPPI|nr:hypothetical protein NPIL_446501 [Nephila pilipes]
MILRPSLLYACSIWGCTTKKNIQKLQLVQNKSLRTIVGAPIFIPRKMLHQELKVTTITEEITKQAKKFYEKIPHHDNPTIRGQKKYLRIKGRHPYPHQSMDREEFIRQEIT